MDRLKKTPSFQTNAPEPAETTPALAPLRWFKVNAINLAGADPLLVKCNACRSDGSDTGHRDFIVAGLFGGAHAVGDLILASRPQGGTGLKYNSEHVSWSQIVPPLIAWGTLNYLWSSGSNLVYLTPCNAAGTPTGAAQIDVLVEFPTTGTAIYCGYAVNDLVPYFIMPGSTPSLPIYALVRNKLPISSAFGQCLFNNAATSSPPNYVMDFLRGV